MRKITLAFCILLVSCAGSRQQDYSVFQQKTSKPSQIAYITKNLSIDKGIDLYMQHFQETKEHNYTSIRSMANAILLNGVASGDPKIQIMTLFATKLAKAEYLTFNIAPLIKSSYFEVQQTAIDTLSTFENENAIQTLFQAFSSDFLFTRLQAAYVLAQQKRLNALSQIESLMHKSPPEIKPYFCELFAKVGGGYGLQILQNTLTDESAIVKAQSIIHAALNQREELKSPILQAATHTSAIEQEAASFAMGLMGIEEGMDRLKQLTNSPHPFVQLSAANSLYQLGQLEARRTIEKFAIKDDLFALGMLGSIHEAKSLLKEKLSSNDLDVRINATIGLLMQKQEVPMENIIEALFLNYRGISFTLSYSSAHTLHAIKTMPNYEVLSSENPAIFGLNQQIKQMMMQMIFQQPEEQFLEVAKAIIENRFDDLVPITTVMLENLQTKDAKHLLQLCSNALGYPLLRGSAMLSLYRMNKEKVYFDKLKQFAKKELEKGLLELRALFFGELKSEKKRFELTAEERTALLMETIYTLAEEKRDDILTLLMEGLKTTNEQNRYLLAGLILSLL